MIRFINKNGSQIPNEPNAIPVAGRSAKLKLSVAALAGALFYVIANYISPGADLNNGSPAPFQPRPPAMIEYLWRLSRLMGNFEVVLVLSVVFVFLAVYRRHRSDAWIFAFIAGGALPHILLHWAGGR